MTDLEVLAEAETAMALYAVEVMGALTVLLDAGMGPSAEPLTSDLREAVAAFDAFAPKRWWTR